MTENKRMSISGLLDVLDTGLSLNTCHMEYAIQSDILEDLIHCLKEIEQYRAIGTVEEFKKLKETLDERLYEKLIYHKVKEDSYNQAITEFAERLKIKLGSYYDHYMIDEVAEEMKAGAE